ncbi:hypothetical protein [Phenylobacterium deserti]|uniref:Two pore domain potassium channel family protein n=1 Tax=Phenylobacterium deserti TaxID=1914756 RepID=A0A328A8Z7_9CAUL|nr:hypothetical protein [Phenylobacterium deserti]RAK51041.1 hypothetical protein DJ018_17975 [Phenylobacterium deserti]
MPGLWGELLISFGMVALTVTTHLVGLMGILRATAYHIEHWRTPWLPLDRLLVPLAVATALFLLHGLEVWAYALLFLAGEATDGLEQALFVSAGAYSTAGWMNAEVSDGWRIVAVLESLNGMLLLGWSTAFLFQTLHRVLTTEDQHPIPEGAIAQEETGVAGKDSPRPKRSGKGAPDGTNSSETELMQ